MASSAGIQIDSLIVSLGLDPSKFTQGQAAAVASFKALQQNATKQAKQFEEAANRIMNFMSRIRLQAVGFAAAAFGAHGIGDFVQKITSTNAALDRTAQTLGISARALSNWGGAARLMGGSTEVMQKAVGNLLLQLQRFVTTQGREGGEILPWLNALNIQVADSKGKIKDWQQLLFDVAEGFKKELKPTERTIFGQQFGLDEGGILLLARGREGAKKLVDEVDRMNTVTQDAINKSSELAQQWQRTGIAAENFGNRIVTALSPALTWLLGGFQRVFDPLGARTAAGAMNRASGVGGGKGAEGLPASPSAGSASVGISALASSLHNSIPGLNRFTAFNDDFHKGTGSKHEQGLALDFTVKDPAQAASAAAAIRKRLAELGVGATVLNEYDPKERSKNSTGPHIHVGFANAAAAERFRSVGAGPAAFSPVGGGAGNTEVNISAININAPGADSQEIARNVANNLRIRLRAFAGNAQTGSS